MDEIIRISVEVLDQEPVFLCVNSYDAIGALDTRLNLPRDKLVIYEQVCISPTFSYKYYRIHEGSRLIVVPIQIRKQTRAKPGEIEKRSLTPPAPNIKMSFFLDKMPFIQPELAKIKDQFFKKVEGTVLCNRKLMQKFKGLLDRADETKNLETTVYSVLAKDPSTEALPAIWDSDDIDK